MAIQESGEMYLEAILVLSRKGAVRAIDVAEYRGYSKPSVSRAVGLLREGGYIELDAGGNITLTEEGCRVAETIFERHELLTDFLVRIGVNPQTAAEDACGLEHAISDTSFQALKRHVDSL